ncbi:MAG: DJ/PfpI family protein [Rhodospirillales bacterium]|nr:DJ/PfpI family protein [Rhodospirillales bacterium]
MQIGFLLFPRLTQLDLTGPYEMLTRAPEATVRLVAKTREPVTSDSNLTIHPHACFDDVASLDVLVVPGGPGHLDAMLDHDTQHWLREVAVGCSWVTSVCTGALVLGAAGLLKNYRATTHWMSLERLATFGATPVDARVVVDRDRITGGGVTAGIDFGLTLLAQLSGEAVARRVALQTEYAPSPPFPGRAEEADPDDVAAIRARAASYIEKMRTTDAVAAARLRQITL